MEKVYNSKFTFTEVDKANKLLKITWTKETKEIDDADYRKEIINYVKLIEEYEPDLIIDDAKLYSSAIQVETQEWLGQTVFPVLQKNVKKYAMVMPDEFFGNISAELNISEVQKVGNVNVKKFKTEEEVMGWFEEE